MKRSDYTAKMETLHNDTNNYGRITDDPTPKVKKCAQKILHDRRLKCYMGKDIKKYGINNDNSNLASAYGLPMIHKENSPVTITVSDINLPTSTLSKSFKTIITKSLHYIKNFWEFKVIVHPSEIGKLEKHEVNSGRPCSYRSKIK